MRAIRGACEGAFATEGDARPERERGMLVRDASPLPPKSRAGRNARNGYISEGERRRRTVKRRFESAHRRRIENANFFRFFLDSFIPRAFSPRKSRTVVHTRHRRASITRLWARIPPPREATSSSRSPSVEKQRSAPPRAPDLAPRPKRRAPSHTLVRAKLDERRGLRSGPRDVFVQSAAAVPRARGCVDAPRTFRGPADDVDAFVLSATPAGERERFTSARRPPRAPSAPRPRDLH